jgi:NitT/TauT family transport system substrate-binding protein
MLRKLMVLPFFAFVLGVTFAGVAAAQAKPTPIRFQMDWRFGATSAPFLVAKAKGYFARENLDVTIDAGSGSALAVQRLGSGAYDMGAADTTSLIEFLAENQANPALRIQAVFMLYDATPSAVLALKKSGISKPSDLKGKVLGAPSFDGGRKLFPMFARANGLDTGSVRWQTMDANLRETMLARGEVDAITGFDFTSRLNLVARGIKEEDIVVMAYPDYGVNVYGNAVMVTPKFMRDSPEAVAGFLRALTRGMRDTVANPEEAIRIVKERDPLIDSAIELRRLQIVLDKSIGSPNVRRNGVGAIDKLRFETTMTQVVQTYQLKSPPNLDNVFNSTFLPAKAERMIFQN